MNPVKELVGIYQFHRNRRIQARQWDELMQRPRKSKKMIFYSWLGKVERIHDQAIHDKDYLAALRANLIRKQLINRLGQL